MRLRPDALLLAICPFTLAVPATASEPATVADAAERLDLVTLPVIEGSTLPGYRREARLQYTTKRSTGEVFDFIDGQLNDRGWKQLPGAQKHLGQGFASADYLHGDYVVHVSVYPGGAGSQGVSISHQGNIPLTDLPAPGNAEKMHGFVSTLMYKSPDGVEETAMACREKMLADGWSPYGGAGDTDYFRRNAVMAKVRTMSAPAQGGATVINYSTELLSLELPAAPFADGFRYSDGTTDIMFDCDKTAEEAHAFYRGRLAPLGWTATTDKPFEYKWSLQTIFRNAGREMITVSTHDFEGRTRVRLDHQNAVEVVQDEYLMRSDAGEKAKYRNKRWLAVSLLVPPGLTADQEEKWAIKLAAPKGEAFTAADKLAASLESDGWATDEPAPLEPVYRSRRFEKGDRAVWVMAIEPPKRTAWVAVIGIGGVDFKPIN